MFDNPAGAINERADSTKVRFICSSTPFCWGDCGTVNSATIVLSQCSYRFAGIVGRCGFKCFKFIKHFWLVFHEIYGTALSVIINKRNEILRSSNHVCIGPQRSLCTKCSFRVDRISPPAENGFLIRFISPVKHPSQKDSSVSFWTLIPCTVSLDTFFEAWLVYMPETLMP